jgi:tetratricopeptide (TPR) repeat protein
MKDYTSLSERLDPEEVDAVISSVFALFDEIIRKHDGMVEKYIGDALVAIFGVPRLHEDDPSRAVNAALEFLHEIRHREIEVRFRCGVHTGLIATGTRGGFSVVTGHAMSVASRLQTLADENDVLVSETTKEKCDDEFLFSEPLILPVRGRERPVRAYRIRGKNFRPLQYQTPFVGRQDFLNWLLRAYMRHDGTRASGICMVGAPGIGKTRTILEFIGKVGEFPDYRAPFLYAKARRFRNLPFAAIRELLLWYLRMDYFVDHERVADELPRRLGVDRSLAGRFADLVHGDVSDSEGDTFMVLERILERITASSEDQPYPAVMFIDNIHSIDKESTDFLRYFMRNARLKPFFVLTGRQEHQQLRSVFQSLEHVELPPLTEDESRELAKALWPEQEDEKLIQRILEPAAGNPLFIEQYVAYARDTGETDRLPPTIESIFLANVDGYEPRTRDLLRKLSVFDRSFAVDDARYIEEQTGGSPEGVVDILKDMVQEGQLVQDEGNYHFRHDLFRRTLYDSLLNYNKKTLHGLVADRIKSVQPSSSLRLLHHLALAERHQELSDEFFRDPRHVYYAEYLPYVDVMIRQTEKGSPDYVMYLFQKYAIMFNSGRTEGCEEIVQELIDLCIEYRQTENAARVYHILCVDYLVANAFVKAIMFAERALAYYRQVDQNHESIPNVLRNEATAALLANRVELNDEIIVQIPEDSDEKMLGNRSLALVERFLHLGEYRNALDILQPRLPEPTGIAHVVQYEGFKALAMVYFRTFDHMRLKELCRSLVRIESQPAAFYTDMYGMLCIAAYRTGNQDTAVDYASQAEYFSYQVRNDCTLMQSIRILGIAYLVSGQPEKAEEIVQRGLRIGMRYGAYYNQFGLLMLLVELYADQGKDQEALFFLGEADLIVGMNTLLNSQELILYHYFKYRYGNGEEAGRELDRAGALLTEEKRRLGREELVESFLSSRAYGEIHRITSGSRQPAD